MEADTQETNPRSFISNSIFSLLSQHNSDVLMIVTGIITLSDIRLQKTREMAVSITLRAIHFPLTFSPYQ